MDLRPLHSERNHFAGEERELLKAFDQTWVQLLECLRCRFAFTKEVPQDPGFFAQRYDIRFDPKAEHHNPFKDQILRDILGMLARHGKASGRFLDVGSFAGVLLRLAAAAGFEVEGVEVNPTMASYCRNVAGFKVHAGEFLKTELRADHYDVLTMVDVLEHLLRPREVLEKCWQCLRPGGLLLIKVPNYRAQIVKQRIANILNVSEQGVFENFGHINHFSPASLRWALDDIGFEVLEIVTARSEHLPAGSPKNEIKNRARDTVSFVAEGIRRLTGINLGLNIIALARKPL